MFYMCLMKAMTSKRRERHDTGAITIAIIIMIM